MFFDAESHERLENFSMDVFSPERERIARQLLRQGAGTLRRRIRHHIAKDGSRDADGVDPEMVIKTRVLTSKKRLDEKRRHLFKRHHQPVFPSQTPVRLAVAVKHRRTLADLLHISHVKLRRPDRIHAAN